MNVRIMLSTPVGVGFGSRTPGAVHSLGLVHRSRVQ